MKWPWQRDRKPKPTPTIPEGAVRRRLRYTGSVQGVGFRFTAEAWARDRGVTGWVTNLVDGDVVMEVQGTPEQVAAFMGDIAAESVRKGAFIHATLVSDEAKEPVPENRFSIRNVNF